jgi:hypothetical protein
VFDMQVVIVCQKKHEILILYTGDLKPRSYLCPEDLTFPGSSLRFKPSLSKKFVRAVHGGRQCWDKRPEQG